ncbi:hypothetical protein MTR_7g085277 [Medicago truncatula]|uniref:Uncharacterized protein n=1 Tax=Medicago truncatula TaxID=3880 RepID=A0A072U283_MEDTR|nr:hypothetical protein MTR_7g085277 [Medicago truncatula]
MQLQLLNHACGTNQGIKPSTYRVQLYSQGIKPSTYRANRLTGHQALNVRSKGSQGIKPSTLYEYAWTQQLTI